MSSIEVDLLLINPYYHIRSGSGSVFPLGNGYISAAVRKDGFSVKFIDTSFLFHKSDNFEERFIDELKFLKPTLIGIGPTTTTSIRSIININKLCKQTHPQVPVIFGGPLATIKSQKWVFYELLNGEAVIEGNGEQKVINILRYLKSCSRKEISQYSLQHFNDDQTIDEYDYFEELIPDRIYDNYFPSLRRSLSSNPFATLIGSKGCIRNCDFCVSGAINHYKRRSFESIIKEITYLNKDKGIKDFIFYDDCFFPNKKTVNSEIEFFAKTVYDKKTNFYWQMELSPDVFSEIETSNFDLLYKIGCRQINIGFERNDPQGLNYFNKSYSVDKIKNKCDDLIKFDKKLRLNGTFIISGPNSSGERINELIRFSKELNLMFAHFNPLFLYPGTVLYDKIFPNQPKYWYEVIRENEDFHGDVLYEDENLNRANISYYISKAYSEFYDKKWESMAIAKVGANFSIAMEEIHKMKNNRF